MLRSKSSLAQLQRSTDLTVRTGSTRVSSVNGSILGCVLSILYSKGVRSDSKITESITRVFV